MKQLFIGLLIIAAGAGGYYFLQNKNPRAIEKELLIGKWTVDSLYAPPKDSLSVMILLKDSTFRKFAYDFQKNGVFLQTKTDPSRIDSSYYEWNNNDELLIKESAKDSTGETYSVKKLNRDSLVLQSKDSAVFVLRKIR